MEAKRRFADASILGNKDRLEPKMDPSMLTTFLETCMKLLRDRKAVKGLHELINRCVGTARSPEAQKAHDVDGKGDEIDHTD